MPTTAVQRSASIVIGSRLQTLKRSPTRKAIKVIIATGTQGTEFSLCQDHNAATLAALDIPSNRGALPLSRKQLWQLGEMRRSRGYENSPPERPKFQPPPPATKPRGNRLPLASGPERWGRRIHTGPGFFYVTAIYGWTSPIIASFTTITILRTNR